MWAESIGDEANNQATSQVWINKDTQPWPEKPGFPRLFQKSSKQKSICLEHFGLLFQFFVLVEIHTVYDSQMRRQCVFWFETLTTQATLHPNVSEIFD